MTRNTKMTHGDIKFINKVKLICTHDGLNPTYVPCWLVHNPTIWGFSASLIGRADIEGSNKHKLWGLSSRKPVDNSKATFPHPPRPIEFGSRKLVFKEAFQVVS